MKKICFVKCKKYGNIQILNFLYIWSNTSVPSSSCADFGSNGNRIFTEEESIGLLKIFCLIINKKE